VSSEWAVVARLAACCSLRWARSSDAARISAIARDTLLAPTRTARSASAMAPTAEL
jgi:hypothetical protein